MRKITIVLLFVASTFFTIQTQAQITPTGNILYVDSAATGTGSGSNWSNAVTDLADALHYARENAALYTSSTLHIYVAKGTYMPEYRATDSTKNITDRNDAFVMVKNVQLYGGFNPAIGDSTMTTRNWNANPTILSGDIGTPNDTSDNCYHIVVAIDSLGNALMDGFSIIKGNAADGGNGMSTIDGESLYLNSGAGIFFYSSNFLLTNTIISSNTATYGAGVYNELSSSVLTNVAIINNAALVQQGGGMYNEASSPKLINVIFKNNTADLQGGAMVNWNNSNPTLINVLVVDNTSKYAGGILNQTNSSPTFTNVTVANNYSTDQGAGIYDYGTSSPTLNNCIVYGNKAGNNIGNNIYNDGTGTNIPIFQYSYVGGSTAHWGSGSGYWGIDSVGNIVSTQNPFIDTANGNYQLKCSLIVDSGSDGLYIAAGGNLTNDTDLAGHSRLIGSSIDMGAYEFQKAGEISGLNQICQNDTVQLNNYVSGGTWVSTDTSVAVVDSTGQLIGLIGGQDTIYYVVNNLSCGIDTSVIIVTVNSFPTASFSTTIVNDSTVFINNNSSGADSYAWNYGNGDTSSNSNSSYLYVYDSAGTYTITLISSNMCGSDTTSQDVTVTLGIKQFNSISGVSVIPNPFRNNINLQIELQKSSKAEIEITGITGKVIYRNNEMLHFGTNTISLSKVFQNQSEGMYFINVKLANGSKVLRKVIKVK